jgi:hypothetical protein
VGIIMSEIVTPGNQLGWLKKKLDSAEMNHLWESIDNKKEYHKDKLAGIITGSWKLEDKNDWFWNNTLVPLCGEYADKFENLGADIPTSKRHPYYMHSWWVNYQKQNEFNPLHTHGGTYSFVIWMKIPTDYKEQQQLPKSVGATSDAISNFVFTYTDLLGNIQTYTYFMSPKLEGTLLFFPAKLAHQVYPFYNCRDTRISISGNIQVDSSRTL